ncbi:biotin transporter BioY [Cellulomonas sp. McL0617]|uniref:biotin transporter BioY n=1 Tax=Cellulomonas sp. McL0617 TaxID=3415675 RepID=UPI003CEB3B75
MSTAPDAVPAVTDSATLAAPVARSSVATDVALIASFAAFIAVCAILPAIPTGDSGVPITLQTFGVILAGLVLGWRRGALAVLLYLAVGLAGVPIFSGGAGGIAVLAGASVGYLLAFPFGAALAGAFASLGIRWSAPGTKAGPGWLYPFLVLSGILGSFLTIHVGGIVGLMVRLDLTFHEALVIDAHFIPGDILKNLAAGAVALAIFKAFPDMLRTRR